MIIFMAEEIKYTKSKKIEDIFIPNTYWEFIDGLEGPDLYKYITMYRNKIAKQCNIPLSNVVGYFQTDCFNGPDTGFYIGTKIMTPKETFYFLRKNERSEKFIRRLHYLYNSANRGRRKSS